MKSKLVTMETMADFLSDGVAQNWKISNSPRASTHITPRDWEIALRIEAQELANVDFLEEVNCSWYSEPTQGDGAAELRIKAYGHIYEAYLLLENIVERCQGGQSFPESVSDAISGFAYFSNSTKVLSEARQIGLIGELLLLQEIEARVGLEVALDAWLGPFRAEHDFKLPSFDVEVKTTSSERREHQIGSLMQLEPSANRPLYLLSIQLTKSGASSQGASLRKISERLIGLSPDTSTRLTQGLVSAGWNPDHLDHYDTAYEVRTESLVFLVDDLFPKLSPASLALRPEDAAKISDIKYRLDLTEQKDGFPLALLLEKDQI